MNSANSRLSELGDMNFWGHLEELRKRLFWSVFVLVVGIGVAFIFQDFIINAVVLKPARDYQINLLNTKPFGQVFFVFKIMMIAGFVFSSPFILFQVWSFVEPGLYQHEKGWVRKITVFTSACFLMGISFSYFVMIPLMFQFSKGFGQNMTYGLIEDKIEITEIFSFLATTVLATGLVFEMPMIVWVLTRVGMMTPQFLSKYRRHSIVVILIIAAVITPTPDPVTQLIFAIPLYVLYEVSIVVSKFAKPKEKKTT